MALGIWALDRVGHEGNLVVLRFRWMGLDRTHSHQGHAVSDWPKNRMLEHGKKMAPSALCHNDAR